MKRNILFSTCLLLLIVGILFAGTALLNQTNPENAEEVASYHIYNDLSVIKASSAAYLLDPDFIVTPDNFADCMDGYFKAPTLLYFGLLFDSDQIWAIKDYKKAAAFSTAFHDVSLTMLPAEDLPAIDEHDDYYNFYNVISRLSLYEHENVTYIKFMGTSFCTDGDLISEVISIAESLKKDSIELPSFDLPDQ